MPSLKKFLLEKGYVQIPLTLTKTNHFEVIATLNAVEGRFILDTGASSTCVGFDCTETFKLSAQASEIKAAGAGAINMATKVSKKNRLEIGNFKITNLKLVLFDLTHVNSALTQHDALPVHGIIGADVLKRAKAVVDYKSKSVFLKP